VQSVCILIRPIIVALAEVNPANCALVGLLQHASGRVTLQRALAEKPPSGVTVTPVEVLDADVHSVQPPLKLRPLTGEP
jgi:hypothetical protein